MNDLVITVREAQEGFEATIQDEPNTSVTGYGRTIQRAVEDALRLCGKGDDHIASYSIDRERDGCVAYDDDTGTQVTHHHELEADCREELGAYLIRTQGDEGE